MFVLASSSLSLTPTLFPSFSLLCLPFPWVDILLPAAVVTTAASINRNHRTRHQVKPHQRPLHLESPHRLWYIHYAQKGEGEGEREGTKDGSSSSKGEGDGRRKEGDARARGRLAAVAQPSVLSAPTPVRDQAGPTTPVAASTANRRYIGRPDVCRR